MLQASSEDASHDVLLRQPIFCRGGDHPKQRHFSFWNWRMALVHLGDPGRPILRDLFLEHHFPIFSTPYLEHKRTLYLEHGKMF